MNCTRFRPYLSAVSDELDPMTASLLDAHRSSCAACRVESDRYAAIHRGLAAVALRDPEVPYTLVPSILAGTVDRPRSRAGAALLPIPPVELARVLQENREVIVSAGAAAVVATGAAWIIFKGLRALTKPSAQRA